MPRKTEILTTEYRGVTPDGTVIAESKQRNTVKRKMRHYPDGDIQTRDLVGYYTPWTTSPEPKEDGK
jgi:hypothetical protein